jgi:hypothetical protein
MVWIVGGSIAQAVVDLARSEQAAKRAGFGITRPTPLGEIPCLDETLFEHFRLSHHQLCHNRSIFYSIVRTKYSLTCCCLDSWAAQCHQML